MAPAALAGTTDSMAKEGERESTRRRLKPPNSNPAKVAEVLGISWTTLHPQGREFGLA